MKKIFFLCLVINIFSLEKVTIFTYAYNRPEFIALQDKCFKKFLKENFDFIVFNDARDAKNEKAIQSECHKLGIQCVRIPQEIHTRPYLQRFSGEDWNHPSVRNSNVVQYSLDYVGFNKKDYLLLLDSDIFLISSFSVLEYMKDCQLSGCLQSGSNKNNFINYIWIGLVFLDMNTLPNIRTINFNCGRINSVPVDAGGFTYFYLTNYPMIKKKYFGSCGISEFYCETCKKNSQICTHNKNILERNGFSEEEIDFLMSGITNSEFFLGKQFFHYRGGSNWDHKPNEYHIKKFENLKNFIDKITSN